MKTFFALLLIVLGINDNALRAACTAVEMIDDSSLFCERVISRSIYRFKNLSQ